MIYLKKYNERIKTRIDILNDFKEIEEDVTTGLVDILDMDFKVSYSDYYSNMQIRILKERVDGKLSGISFSSIETPIVSLLAYMIDQYKLGDEVLFYYEKLGYNEQFITSKELVNIKELIDGKTLSIDNLYAIVFQVMN